MDKHEHNTSGRKFPVSRVSANEIADIDLKTFNDGPRALDLDIAKRLGFDRPRDIRKLIERNLDELVRFGVCATVALTSGPKGGRPGKEYWLNEEQALLVATLSETEKAAEVRHMLIKVFVAWRRGDLPPAPVKVNVPTNERLAVAREGRLQFKMFQSVARTIGLKGNQAVLSANRATKMTTGFDVMGALGITHIDAQVNQPDIRPSDIAERLGLRSAQEANKLLVRFEYQNALRDHKGHVYYELTPKGERAGGVFKDTDKKTGHGVPIKQLMWASRIVDLLRADMEREGV
jgi:hypothetical protein